MVEIASAELVVKDLPPTEETIDQLEDLLAMERDPTVPVIAISVFYMAIFRLINCHFPNWCKLHRCLPRTSGQEHSKLQFSSACTRRAATISFRQKNIRSGLHFSLLSIAENLCPLTNRYC